MLAVDKEGSVTRWNQAAAAATGISPAEICGRSFEEAVLFPGDGKLWRVETTRVFAGAPSRYFEIRWNNRNGPLLFLTCSCSLLRAGSDGDHIVCTAVPNLLREFVDERVRELKDISRFIHDTISQDLVMLSFALAGVESSHELLDQCCRDIRLLSSMLTPPHLPAATFEASLEQHAASLRAETDLAVTLDLDPVSDGLSTGTQLLLAAAFQLWAGRGIRARPRPALRAHLRNRAGWIVLTLETAWSSPRSVTATDLDGWSLIREGTSALRGRFALVGGVGASGYTLSLMFPEPFQA